MARAQNPNRPVAGVQFAPATGSNAGYPTSWVDLTARVLGWSAGYGKQRELGLAEAGTSTFLCYDVDEYLNPANTSSPWNSGGNLLKLYRPIRRWEMCGAYTPGTGFSFTGNMLNSAVALADGTVVNDLWLKVLGRTGTYADTSTFEGGTVGGWTNDGTTTTVANSGVRAHDGTKSMLVTWPAQTGGGAASQARASVPAPPLRTGDRYTLSLYLWITSGPAVTVALNGSTATSTTTTGAWQRVTLTFTAQDGANMIVLYAAGSTTAGQNVAVDSVQLEWAGSASAFTTTGPTIYPVFTGFIERYPTTWQHNGYLGRCEMACVDALGMMPRVALLDVLSQEINADAPNFWWSFDDGVEAGSTFNQKGITKDPTIRNWGGESAPNASSTTGGSRIGPGPDRPTTLTINVAWVSGGPPTTPDDGAGFFNDWVGSQVGGTAAGFTVELWFAAQSTMAWQGRILGMCGTNNTPNDDEYQFDVLASGKLSAVYKNSSGTTLESIVSAGSVVDGAWHHLVFRTSASGATITSQLWLDGTSVGTATRSGASIPVRNKLLIGSGQDGSGFMQVIAGTGYVPFWGSVSNLAIYQGGSLSSARITAHYTAGHTGFGPETAGARIQRILNWAGWAGIGNNINTALGVSVGPARGMDGQLSSDYIKLTSDTDQGLVIADPSGLLTFLPQSAIAAAVSSITFGENESGGEIPYLEGAQAELEPSQVYNDITVNPYALVANDTYLVPVAVADATSESDYGVRSLSVDILPANGASGLTQIQNMAAFLLAQRKDPHLMVSGVVVNLAANPAMWPAMLAARVGQAGTWKRRTSAFTMSVPGYLETMAWSEAPDEGARVALSIEPAQV